jgi:DNA-directed RNA polymerase I subunit RPA1
MLMLSIAQQAAEYTIIRQVPGIDRAFVMANEAETDKSITVGTEGLSFAGVFDPRINVDEIIDMTRLGTNDVHAMLKTYGVEACRATIVNEIAGVFGVYGICVDPRHLNLIADYMTFEGGYKAFNRLGMLSNPSPFAQMSFETTSQFLTTATLAGETDYLDSPSAGIVVGKVVGCGTGGFEVFMEVK